MKWGTIMLPSLTTAARTITEAWFLLYTAGETSEGSHSITWVFWPSVNSSTVNFFATTKKQTCPPLLFRLLWGFEHFFQTPAGSDQVAASFHDRFHLKVVLGLTLRFLVSCNTDWLGSTFIDLFSPVKKNVRSFSIISWAVMNSFNFTRSISVGYKSISSRLRVTSSFLLYMTESFQRSSTRIWPFEWLIPP